MRFHLTFILLISVVCLSTGQFRVKAGMTYSDLRLDQDFFPNDYNFGLNYMVGVEYNIGLTNLIGLETGLDYYRLHNNGENLEDIQRSYMAIPLIVSFKPNSLISPGLGFLASTNASGEPKSIFFKRYDVSAIAKIAVKPFQHIALEIGYNLGFVPFSELIFTNEFGDEIGKANLHNKFYFLRVSIDL